MGRAPLASRIAPHCRFMALARFAASKPKVELPLFMDSLNRSVIECSTELD